MIQAPKGNPGSKAQSDRADARAASLAPILTKLRAGGVTSSGALAAALTARNILVGCPGASPRQARGRGTLIETRDAQDLIACDTGCGSAGTRPAES